MCGQRVLQNRDGPYASLTSHHPILAKHYQLFFSYDNCPGGQGSLGVVGYSP